MIDKTQIMCTPQAVCVSDIFSFYHGRWVLYRQQNTLKVEIWMLRGHLV